MKSAIKKLVTEFLQDVGKLVANLLLGVRGLVATLLEDIVTIVKKKE